MGLNLTEFAQECLKSVAPLGPILFRAIEPSVQEAQNFFEDGRRFDGHVFADLCRYYSCSRLAAITFPRGVKFWRLQNNGMAFICNGHLVRVWKGDEDGELRGPGSSKVKRQFFDQPFLDLFSPDHALVRLAVIWDYDWATKMLELSLTCPKRFDTYNPWLNPECHFYVEFPHAATQVLPSAVFSESPDLLDDIDLRPKRRTEEVDPEEGPGNG